MQPEPKPGLFKREETQTQRKLRNKIELPIVLKAIDDLPEGTEFCAHDLAVKLGMETRSVARYIPRSKKALMVGRRKFLFPTNDGTVVFYRRKN